MLLRISGETAVLHSPATPRLLGVLQRLEGRRRWLVCNKQLQLEGTPHNISVLQELPGLVVERSEPRAVPSPSRPALPAYQPLAEPPLYPHQLRALAQMRLRPTFGLFMEQGTGKTRVIVDRLGELHAAGEVTGVLVVSKKGVHRQWIEAEVPTWFNAPFTGQFWPVKKIDPPTAGKLAWFGINIDGLARSKEGLQRVTEFCRQHPGKLAIVWDESQDGKDWRTSRHKVMMAIKPHSSFRFIATGTPIAKDLTDEWVQLKWLDEPILGVKYVTTFRREYCIMGGFEGRQVVGHRNIARFKELTAPATFRATKEEIGLLPKQFNIWPYDLTPKQLAMMRSLKSELEAVLDNGELVTAANAVSALSKFQQVASGFLIGENSEAHEVMPLARNPKLTAAIDWVNADDGAAIVWFRFREEARMLAHAFAEAGISYVEYHGGVKDKDRERAKQLFLTEGGPKVFLANPQSAGTGLNLQGRCARALYFSNSFNSIDRWQSEDRIHRIGTKAICVYTDMVAKGSLDAYILRNLRKKKGLSDMVLGTSLRVEDVKEALEELE
jgi:hypothetical protein